MQAEYVAPDAGNGMPVIPDRFASLLELKACLEELPLFRAPRTGIDPRQSVVACHISDLEEAVAYYRQSGDVLPKFYVLGLNVEEKPALPAQANLHAFSGLEQGMDIQLYFRQGGGAGSTPYSYLAMTLHRMGIKKFHIERWCTEKFFRRNAFQQYTDADWDTILQFTNALADAESRYVYLAVCRSSLESDPGYIPIVDYQQYFHPRIFVEPGDIICEGGCFANTRNGKIVNSSTLNFREALQGSGAIVAFEPVEGTARELSSAFASYENIRIEHKALWSRTGSLLLQGDGALASTTMPESGEGNCPCVSIDDYFSPPSLPSVIKLDVEGAEPDVLTGARRTLQQACPKLMVAIYHHFYGTDWVTIPRMLLESGLPYEYFCGHHRPWFSETILYAGRKAEK